MLIWTRAFASHVKADGGYSNLLMSIIWNSPPWAEDLRVVASVEILMLHASLDYGRGLL
jgi:hypothetical protein